MKLADLRVESVAHELKVGLLTGRDEDTVWSLCHPCLLKFLKSDVALCLWSEVVFFLLFPSVGVDLVEDYHLDSRIVDIVRLMTKRYDFTPEEEKAFFDQIAANKFSALIKLSDRGNNVEDSYNMSVWKIHEYIDETNKFFIPIDYHAKRSFPELYPYLEILEDKIVSLTSLAMTLVDRYNDEEKELRLRLENLKLENKYLNEELERLRNEGEEHD